MRRTEEVKGTVDGDGDSDCDCDADGAGASDWRVDEARRGCAAPPEVPHATRRPAVTSANALGARPLGSTTDGTFLARHRLSGNPEERPDLGWQHGRVDLITSLPAFLAFVVAVSAVPGPAVILILRRSAVHSGRATVPLVLGLETALVLWALAAAFGLAALIAVSEVAYAVLRVSGTVVLVVLGALAVRTAWRMRLAARDGRTDEHDVLAQAGLDEGTTPLPSARALTARRAYVEGLATNLANPKAAVFMIAFFPQFIPHGYPVVPSTLALAAVQVTVETGLYCGLAFGVSRARHVLAHPRARAAIEAVSGTVLLGLGVKIATTARSTA
jgi:threonine/homoserine/homoserine lactone efflux protein